MIPVRLHLHGFLSWREPQTLRFDTARLWLLTGPNGSGKSALFDALTFALFGHHRGGSTNSSDLIHKDCPALGVEFDFILDGNRYRIHRGVKRTRTAATSTQQVSHFQNDVWHELPETAKRAGFDAWIKDRLGYTYETFTAGVLLLQGRAERLLDATPKGRAEVLADLVGLDRVQKLHDLANQDKLKCKAVLEAISAQTESLPLVTEAELKTATESHRNAEAILQRHRHELDSLLKTADELRQFLELTTRSETARQKLAKAEGLLGDAARIDHDAAHLLELQAVLPIAEAVVITRGKQRDSEHKSDRLKKQHQVQQQIQAEREHDLTTAKAKRTALQKQLTSDEAKLAQGTQRLRELTGTLQTLRLLDDQQAEASRLDRELATMPKSLDEDLANANQQLQRGLNAGQWLPVLERRNRERNELAAVLERKTALTAESDRIRREGEIARKAHDALVSQHTATIEKRTAAERSRTEAELTLRQAMTARDEFAAFEHESTCRACGQPLTPEHLALEQGRRQQAVHGAEQRAATVRRDCESAIAVEEQFRRDVDASTENLTRLRIEFKEQSAALANITREIERHQSVIQQATAELPRDLGKEVEQLHREFATLDETKQKRQSLQDQITTRQGLLNQRRTLESTLQRLRSGLPRDGSDALREEHRSRQAEEASLLEAAKAGRKALDEVERTIDRCSREAHAALTEFTDITGRLRTEDATRQHCQETIEREMKKLPPEWQMRVETAGLGDYAAWKETQNALLTARVPERALQLAAARSGLQPLRDEVVTMEAAVAASPMVNGLNGEDVTRRTDETRLQITLAEDAVQTASRHLARLEGVRDQRAHLDDRTRTAELDYARAKRLADLLSRDGLQRHLVRDAEKGIVDGANAILAKLSDDALTLQLAENGTADAALTLEAIHPATSDKPITIAFLSGSQRFRVAVALALGIGKFLRSANCLILDEGFGSLDRLGRESMIRELKALGEQLQCLIVVSHDDDFAGAFPNGYRIELRNNTSVASNLLARRANKDQTSARNS
ncbi:SMC family ATPase [soil metagenome]